MHPSHTHIHHLRALICCGELVSFLVLLSVGWDPEAGAAFRLPCVLVVVWGLFVCSTFQRSPQLMFLI